MMTIILFIGGTAIVGSLCYLAVRPLVLAHWERWCKDRQQACAIQLREQRRQTLHDEATLGVLKQLAQQEETRRGSGRKAA